MSKIKLPKESIHRLGDGTIGHSFSKVKLALNQLQQEPNNKKMQDILRRHLTILIRQGTFPLSHVSLLLPQSNNQNFTAFLDAMTGLKSGTSVADFYRIRDKYTIKLTNIHRNPNLSKQDRENQAEAAKNDLALNLDNFQHFTSTFPAYLDNISAESFKPDNQAKLKAFVNCVESSSKGYPSYSPRQGERPRWSRACTSKVNNTPQEATPEPAEPKTPKTG